MANNSKQPRTLAVVPAHPEQAAVIPYAEIERMGAALAKGGLFGVKTPEQAISLLLLAQAEGLHPAAAARDYHLITIGGVTRPALKAEAMLARFLRAGGSVEWHSLDNREAAATFSHPQGGTIRIDWDIRRATEAGLVGGANGAMWKKYPRQMLRSRVVSEGVRTVWPGVASGVYTVEEVQDGAGFDAAPSRTEAGIAHVQAQWVEHEESPVEASTVEALPAAAAPTVPPPPEETRAGRLYRAYRDLAMTKDLCKLAMAACGHKSTFSDKALDAWDADEFGFFLEVELGHWAEEHQAEIAAAQAGQP